MMVIFTSQSEKKALPAVRRVLDLFAERIGTDTWKTVITAEGLATVKMLLRRTATKNMAVACHWIRSRNRTELLWVVGQRSQFNLTGAVPVNTTQKDLGHRSWENHWKYLPLIQAFTALAALFHDWGKASLHFQNKLKELSRKMDPFRHEWVSCKILEALVIACEAEQDDRVWLSALADGTVDMDKVQNLLISEGENHGWGKLKPLPPVAETLVWLILSHHRMPLLKKEEAGRYEGDARSTIPHMLKAISSQWGYQNEEMSASDQKHCFEFPEGLLWERTSVWTRQVKKWAARMLSKVESVETGGSGPEFQLILMESRLCLMLGDHYVSSLDADPAGNEKYGALDLWANSDPKARVFTGKQRLEEHLVRVCRQALQVAYELPRFEMEMERAEDIRTLRQPSPKKFAWQDKAAAKLRDFPSTSGEKPHWFIVNMASTGCGKTMANAKLMQAVSEDGNSLRYNLALGLRTLTLQTGDEYRNRIGLDRSDMAVLIGSSAVRELHEMDQRLAAGGRGSESEEELLEGTLDYSDTMNEEHQQFMDIFFQKDRPDAGKNEAFLYKPVLVSTIDYLMKATETRRGGRYLLPFLRMMSSDLVIDEIDDFGKEDLLAIARLVHAAGMLGRNVAISSATIPPDLAEGMYRAYAAGLASYRAFFEDHRSIGVLWCDEFRAQAAEMDGRSDTFTVGHQSFVEKRVQSLRKQTAKRKGKVRDFSLMKEESEYDVKKRYFTAIQEEAVQLHHQHGVTDKKSGKIISFGLIRVANIQPCVALSHFLLEAKWPADLTVRLMTYHSRQILLLRHEQERYLDAVLKRKGDLGDAMEIEDPVLRHHIDSAGTGHILFIVIATPVEEVGRDHDFDWAVVEPSSYRSIIQLSGRILRHRNLNDDIRTNNVTVMEYNINGILNRSLAFCRPGYETGDPYRFDSHSVKDLLDEEKLGERIDAVPRIQKQAVLHPSLSLADMEQKVMEDFNQKPEEGQKLGPESLEGWLHQCWWMTALPQYLNPFRRQTGEDVRLAVLLGDDGLQFMEKGRGKVNELYRIQMEKALPKEAQDRLWLVRDYAASLSSYAMPEDTLSEEDSLDAAGWRYGEITLPQAKDTVQEWLYSDQFGLYRKEED